MKKAKLRKTIRQLETRLATSQRVIVFLTTVLVKKFGTKTEQNPTEGDDLK